MGFGLFYIPGRRDGMAAGQVYGSIFDEVDLADRHGWRNVWISEHHCDDFGGLSPSPVVLLSALAARTEQIRLGPAVSVLPLRSGLQVAEEIAMLDLLSGGRAELGIGRGFSVHEFRSLGVALDSRQQRFEEGLQVLLGAWTEHRFSFSGDYYQLVDVEMHPRPLQQPHPPIWIAAALNQESFELAGRYGLNLMLNPYSRTGDELRRGLDWYWEARQKAGHDACSARILVNHHLFVAHSEDAARRVPQEALMEYFSAVDRASIKGGTQAQEPPRPRSYGEMYPDRVMFGTPDSLEGRIRAWMRLGVTDFSFMTQFGNLNSEHSLASVRLFSEEILPRFR
jgi:natural product biosynthesis luciferase-like monooxygenase protein